MTVIDPRALAAPDVLMCMALAAQKSIMQTPGMTQAGACQILQHAIADARKRSPGFVPSPRWSSRFTTAQQAARVNPAKGMPMLLESLTTLIKGISDAWIACEEIRVAINTSMERQRAEKSGR